MILVTSEHREGADLEAEVDEDIREFKAWFRSRGAEPLVNSERAILKTWAWWQLRVKNE